MKITALLILLALVPLVYCDCPKYDCEVEKIIREERAIRKCSENFRSIDALFGEARNTGNVNLTGRYVDEFFQKYFTSDVRYTQTNIPNNRENYVFGRDGVRDIINAQIQRYTFRYTLPPVPNTQWLKDESNRREVQLQSEVNHVFTNASGVYLSFGKHLLHCVEVKTAEFRFDE